ncbi:hypothetical protein C0Q70_02161 [Pomacea canaliculata]|uniref:Anaphase-promoting complex subunit 16 n=1 Tax=Pomacea canaliculata TaxID=400727 RepID=A0A2T7Q1J2_POMCA|nr:uncharacterized protein LOC112566796 [Pomacea canaliculata]PVD39527.1 hypothetical protein C0Q70_02161 [Pomacea canaliculata]
MPTNALLVQLLTQPHLQPSEVAKNGPSTSNKYVLNMPSCTIMNKVQLEHAIDNNTQVLQKDLHEQRLKQLRKLLKDIQEDDWQYEPVEQLIGLK